MSVFADLPTELWKLVMEHISLHERLTSCALVCQKFHAAAVAATECIDVTLRGQRQVDRFMEYLQQYGSHLTSISLTGGGDDHDNFPVLLEQLPCPQLLQLHLDTLDFKLDSDQDRPGLLFSTTALTRLELDNACLLSGGLAALANLPHLHHLSVDWSEMQEADNPDDESAFAWAALQQLTSLSLIGVPVQAGSLRHISSMSRLRVLKVSGDNHHMLPSVAPGMSLPPALQHFEFSGVLGPSALAAATQLTHLHLTWARFQDEGGVSGGMFLLQWLPKLQHLEYLFLSRAHVNWPPPSPAFQPLVASCSKLRVLDIMACSGALAHTFPHSPSHNVVLTSLEVLMAGKVTQEAVAQLVRCCPALVDLIISSPGGDHLTALSQLSTLTFLRLFLLPGGGATSIAVSIQAVARLTRLQGLSLDLEPRDRTCQNLLPLTTLRQLTRLDVGLDTHRPVNRRPLITQVGVLNPPCADCMNRKTWRGAVAWNAFSLLNMAWDN